MTRRYHVRPAADRDIDIIRVIQLWGASSSGPSFGNPVGQDTGSYHSLSNSLQIDGLGTPGAMGTYPALGRPDMVFSRRDQRCRTRTAGVVSSRIFQHL